METEKMKAKAGKLYDANYDAELLDERARCADVIYELNHLHPSQTAERERLFVGLFRKTQGAFTIVPPFFCDYGYNIEIGENFFANTNCVMLDEATISFGSNVFIAPNCGFYTAGHPIDKDLRNKGLEFARPITVGNNVWIGANVCVLPGVSIGDNCVIGAGSVVTKSIPANVVAVGNPCRPVRAITEADKEVY